MVVDDVAANSDVEKQLMEVVAKSSGVGIRFFTIEHTINIIHKASPNQKIFIFTFLIGIPTALMVALFPGSIHPEPGLMRAIFFIMSHMMLVVSSIYILITNKFNITKKDLYAY